MNRPFFSIVIASYNYGQYIEDAIESIINQSCQDWELIIADGGSTDNTVEVIKKYERYISWWCSESDKGQSDAFNKGFSHATGKFYTWLNADDLYMPDALLHVKERLEKNSEASWATGNFIRFREDNKTIVEAKWGPHILPSFLQTFDSPLVIFGPTVFWNSDIAIQIGEFDTSLRYTMDTEYWMRIMKHGYRQVRVNHDIWAFRMHEESKTAEFGSHKLADDIENKINKERLYRVEKWGYKMSRVKRLLAVAFRIIDFSFVYALYRQIFVVGSKLR